MSTDVEMRNNAEKKRVSIEAIRKKFSEWGCFPYLYQKFNKKEGLVYFSNSYHAIFRINCYEKFFDADCQPYESFDFSIEPTMVGETKHCSYSELDRMTNFNNPVLLQNTLTGRLFRGTIVEGSVTRQAIVKTWDYLLPFKPERASRLHKFCDEVELLTDERPNTHPNLVKLYKYCFDMRLAVVYDAQFTDVLLSDVLLSDDFGWDDRMKVAIQLADLFSWLHEKGVAVGSVTTSSIMIDEEVNIKVFDFGYVSNNVNQDTKIPVEVFVGWDAPEAWEGERMMKSDVYVFGLLLLKLIAKNEFICDGHTTLTVRTVDKSADGKKYLVHECFEEVDNSNAFEITLLAFQCLDPDNPDRRPTMKEVVYALKVMQAKKKKRKRDENEGTCREECI